MADVMYYTLTPKDPATWQVCGPIDKPRALNQFKAFGIRYSTDPKNGEYLLDYETLNKQLKRE